MPSRPLTIVSGDADVIDACQAAASLVPDAVSQVREIHSLSELEASVDELQGMLVMDPTVIAPDSVYEWVQHFLREHKALVFLLTRRNVQEADGLARFVGAQGALALPPRPDHLAERLASPFGLAPRVKPEPVRTDERALEDNLETILEGRETTSRDRFLDKILDPESGLFAADFWDHRLDEEFKRSNRFRFPLGLVAFASDGEVDTHVLVDIAGVILLNTRDVDIVSQLDPTTFVALLPHTGLQGTHEFAERVVSKLRELNLKDVMGEPLSWEHREVVGPDSEIPTSHAFLARVLPVRNQNLPA